MLAEFSASLLFIQIPAHLFTDYARSQICTIKLVQVGYMLVHQGANLFSLGRRQLGARLKKMTDFPENPESSLHSSAEHHGVDTGIVEDIPGFLRVVDVAIGDNRNRYGLLNSPDRVVIRFAPLEAGTGTTMHGEGRDTVISGDSGDLHVIAVTRIPSCADLQGDRYLHCIHHGLANCFDLIGGTQQGGTCQLLIHFFFAGHPMLMSTICAPCSTL